MAVMSFNTRMWFWKLYYGSSIKEDEAHNITDLIGKYITSFKVINTLHPQNKKNEVQQSPSTLELTITSNNFMEDIFSPGMYINLFAGRDRTKLTNIFSGIITEYPDGSAQDMLNYTVKASGEIVLLAGMERKFSFLKLRDYRSIIEYICTVENIKSNVILTVEDELKRLGNIGYTTKMGKTSIEVIQYFAKEWKCIFWLSYSKNNERTLNFMSEKLAFREGDIKGLGSYSLGYRTDAIGVPNNIERIEWKHSGTTGGTESIAGSTIFTENGVTVDPGQYKIVYKGKTWVLQAPYLKEVKTKPSNFLKYSGFVIECTTAGIAYQALKTYFKIIPDKDSGGKVDNPATDNGGFELTITLNEGDPTLKPPRTAKLFSGTVNTKISTAHLPNYLFEKSVYSSEGQTLYINETELTYEQGMLKSTLKCSIGDD